MPTAKAREATARMPGRSVAGAGNTQWERGEIEGPRSRVAGDPRGETTILFLSLSLVARLRAATSRMRGIKMRGGLCHALSLKRKKRRSPTTCLRVTMAENSRISLPHLARAPALQDHEIVHAPSILLANTPLIVTHSHSTSP